MFLNRKTLLFLFLLLLVRQTGLAHTHDSLCGQNCNCHERLTPAGIMLSHVHDRNQWMFSYRYMNMQMQGTQSGTTETGADNVFKTYLMSPDKMQMNMHMVMAMYGVTDRLTLMLMGQFVSNQMSMLSFSPGSHHHGGTTEEGGHEMKSQGLGDVELHVMYGLIKTDQHQFIASLGVTAPTGSIQIKGSDNDMMYGGQRLPYGMQTGTGSFDWMPGLTYTYTHDRFGCALQVLGTWRTQANSLGYQWGNELTLNTWAGYNWWGFLGTSVRLEAGAAGPMKGYDKNLYRYNEPAANTYNYGGRRMNAFGGLYLRAKKGCLSNQMLAFEYGLPLYQDLNGIQMPVTQMINAAWSLTF